MAAPFTSKLPTPYSLVEVLRQGRCALVTAHQSFKTMGVSSLVFCYMYSVLYINGVKLADEQHVACGVCMSAFSMLVSFAKPVRELSRERPHASALNPGLLLSVLVQSVVHLACLLAVNSLVAYDIEKEAPAAPGSAAAAAAASLTALAGGASAALGLGADADAFDDLTPSAGLGAAAQLLQSQLGAPAAAAAASILGGAGLGAGLGAGASVGAGAGAGAGAAAEGEGLFGTTPFVPSRLVSAVFLTWAATQGCTYLVSYHGAPFMEPLHAASWLGRGALLLYGACSLGALGWSSQLNESLKLKPLEQLSERLALLALILGDALVCWAAERALRWRFAERPALEEEEKAEAEAEARALT
jgi:magnesium-transporting ATPase (P-type)